MDWALLKAPILAAIMDHFTSGAPLLTGEAAPVDARVYDEDTQASSPRSRICSTAASGRRWRRTAATSSSPISIRESGTVWLHMRGACAGCPSSAATLKSGVETMLRHYVPEVTRVEQVL